MIYRIAAYSLIALPFAGIAYVAPLVFVLLVGITGWVFGICWLLERSHV
jgi:ABC-type sulfate transport system permease subunit